MGKKKGQTTNQAAKPRAATPPKLPPVAGPASVEVKTSSWAKVESLVKPAAYLLGLLGTGFVSGFFFCRAVDQYFGFTRISNDKLVSIARTAEMAETWEFSEPLYEQLPGDFDFIARHLWVSNSNGHAAVLVGPSEGDEIHVSIGGWMKSRGDYLIPFELNGKVAGEEFPTRLGVVKAERHTLSEPVFVHGWEVYLYVEDVKPDQIIVSVIRRKFQQFDEFRRLFRPHNQAMPLGGERAPPILRRKDEQRLGEHSLQDDAVPEKSSPTIPARE